MYKNRLFIVILAAAVFLLSEISVYAQSQEGGSGVSPDRIPKAVVNKPWEKRADTNKDGIVDQAELQKWKEQRAAADKPWEKRADTNKDGIVDQAELQQFKQLGRDRDNNPPGPKGGPGTNWENKPGPQGGPGASPNRSPGMDRNNNPSRPKGRPGAKI